jgi:hypothetical protein
MTHRFLVMAAQNVAPVSMGQISIRAEADASLALK